MFAFFADAYQMLMLSNKTFADVRIELDTHAPLS